MPKTRSWYDVCKGRKLQFNVDFERQIFEKLFHLLKGNRRRNIFFYISFWYMTLDMNSVFTSNKPTHYLLDYGDFFKPKYPYVSFYLSYRYREEVVLCIASVYRTVSASVVLGIAGTIPEDLLAASGLRFISWKGLEITQPVTQGEHNFNKATTMERWKWRKEDGEPYSGT